MCLCFHSLRGCMKSTRSYNHHNTYMVRRSVSRLTILRVIFKIIFDSGAAVGPTLTQYQCSIYKGRHFSDTWLTFHQCWWKDVDLWQVAWQHWSDVWNPLATVRTFANVCSLRNHPEPSTVSNLDYKRDVCLSVCVAIFLRDGQTDIRQSFRGSSGQTRLYLILFMHMRKMGQCFRWNLKCMQPKVGFF